MSSMTGVFFCALCRRPLELDPSIDAQELLKVIAEVQYDVGIKPFLCSFLLAFPFSRSLLFCPSGIPTLLPTPFLINTSFYSSQPSKNVFKK